MSRRDPPDARRLYLAALRVVPGARRAFLEAASRGNAAAAATALALLEAGEDSRAFLHPPTALDLASVRRSHTPGESRSPAVDLLEPPRLAAGVRLAGRYRVGEPLDRGGAGAVWLATDELTGTEVAVKVLPSTRAIDLARARREAATLRWLRLPGVVRLLDDGVEGDAAYLVMERVRGAPFPGANAVPVPWARVHRTTVALLETLVRVHWAGVVHGDLKPGNVLVDAEGLPVVLDLGLSAGPEAPTDPSRAGTIAGTPQYLAPEQVRRQPASTASDLYSIGVMLFEALSGRMPHPQQTLAELFEARRTVPAPPLLSAAPGVPRSVAYLVDRLLRIDPAERPPSARAALEILDASSPGGSSAAALPWVGPRDVVEALAAAGREGRSEDVVGPPGSGRTRALAEACALLEQEGRRVLRVPPGRRPLESLLAAVGDPGVPPGASADDVRREVEWKLSALLASGTVVVADDADALDRLSAEALAGSRGAGSILRSLRTSPTYALALEPLSGPALASLFVGHDRIHHLREDAARELSARTEGRPGRVAAELGAWERAGLARREGDRWIVGREAIERLASGLRVAMDPARGRVPSGAEDPALEDVRVTIDLASSHATVEAVATALDRPRWLLEADVAELERAGLVRVLPGNRLEATSASHGGAAWPVERRLAVHRALARALAHDDPARLFHLLAAEATREVPAAALAAARRLRTEGRPDRAAAVVTEGLRALRTAPEPTIHADLLVVQLEGALEMGTSHPLDLLLYQVERAPDGLPHLDAIEAIARAAIRTLQGDATRAIAAVDALASPLPPTLERCRQSVRILASRYVSIDAEREAVAAVSRLAVERPEVGRGFPLDEWVGWLRYREGRFPEAGTHHERFANAQSNPILAAAGRLSAASAWLEAHDLDRAEAAATQSRDVAARLRHPFLEARAERILRAVAYRRGTAATPDTELVEALRALGNPHLEALVALNEAGVAWRAREPGTARSLAALAADIWGRTGNAAAAPLAHALAWAAGGTAPATGAEGLVRGALSTSPPGVALQVLGLVARVAPAAAPAHRDAAERLAAAIATPQPNARREVLSVSESLAPFVPVVPAVGSGGPTDGP